jgi:hypothetical protein
MVVRHMHAAAWTLVITGAFATSDLVAAASSDVVRKQGSLGVHEYCSVDLDEGRADCMITLDGDGTEPPPHPRGKGYDLWYQPAGRARYLTPQNGALLAPGGPTEAGRSGCDRATYAKSKIRIDLLPQGTHICVRTSEGRLAEFRLNPSVDNKKSVVSITYITWEQ